MIKSYDQMPVGIYKEMIEIATNGKSEDDNAVQIVALLTGKTEEEVLNMPIGDFMAATSAAGFLYEQPKAKKPTKWYKVGKFDCEVDLRPEQMTAAQYIDFKELAPTANENIEMLLAVFLIPKGCTYCDGYDLAELREAILAHLPITKAQSILAFFFKKLQSSIRNTLIFSAALMKAETMKLKGGKKQQMKEVLKKMMEAIRSYESGDGDTLFTWCLGLPILLGVRSIATE